MLGKIIGAVAGAKIADRVGGRGNGPAGALLGMGAVAVARRLGPIGLIAGLAGGYAFKRFSEKRAKRENQPPKVRPSAT